MGDIIPFATEAERALLACLAADNLLLDDIGPLAQHVDWFSMRQRRVTEVTFEMIEAGQNATIISICEEAIRRAAAEGEDLTFADVNACFGSPDMINADAVKSYATQIIKAAYDRRALKWAEKIMAAASAHPDHVIPLATDRDADLAQFHIEPDKDCLAYRYLTAAEAEAMEPSVGILGDLLFKDSITILYGRSGRWKSFVALAMAFAVATGKPLFGRPAKPGPVVYIAAEAANNIGKRITALRIQHDLRPDAPIHLFILPKTVNLMDRSAVETYVRNTLAQLDEPPALVVIDTLARSMPGGDENAAKDANTVYDSAYAIREAFHCCVLIVHHDGKETARGARGSSAIYGNADLVLRITGHEDRAVVHPGDILKLECEKPKDDAPFDPIVFTTDVERWATPAGEFRSSLVITAPEASSVDNGLSATQRQVLDLLFDHQSTGLKSSEWLRLSGLPKQTFYDARSVLDSRGYIRKDYTKQSYHPSAYAIREKSVTEPDGGTEVRSKYERGTA